MHTCILRVLYSISLLGMPQPLQRVQPHLFLSMYPPPSPSLSLCSHATFSMGPSIVTHSNSFILVSFSVLPQHSPSFLLALFLSFTIFWYIILYLVSLLPAFPSTSLTEAWVHVHCYVLSGWHVLNSL